MSHFQRDLYDQETEVLQVLSFQVKMALDVMIMEKKLPENKGTFTLRQLILLHSMKYLPVWNGCELY